MGLYARIDLSEFEEQANGLVDMFSNTLIDIFDNTLDDIDSGTGEEEGGVQWDNMDDIECDFSGCGDAIAQAFASTFMETVNGLCPVRTGYLLSSISCDPGSAEVECYANAEYAQYVEYGTYKMSAQPYFEPAIEAALDAARQAGQEQIQQMSEELEGAMFEAIDYAVDGIETFSIVGAFAALIVIIILYAIASALISMFIDDLTGSLDSALSNAEIQIT